MAASLQVDLLFMFIINAYYEQIKIQHFILSGILYLQTYICVLSFLFYANRAQKMLHMGSLLVIPLKNSSFFSNKYVVMMY